MLRSSMSSSELLSAGPHAARWAKRLVRERPDRTGDGALDRRAASERRGPGRVAGVSREAPGTVPVEDYSECFLSQLRPFRAAIWQAQVSVETPDLVLLERLREVLADQPVTETELRGLIEQADGLVRTLGAHMAGSERRLSELTADPDSSLAEIANELHRVDGLRPRLDEARTLLADLEKRARELRTSWLIRQAEDPLTR